MYINRDIKTMTEDQLQEDHALAMEALQKLQDARKTLDEYENVYNETYRLRNRLSMLEAEKADRKRKRPCIYVVQGRK